MKLLGRFEENSSAQCARKCQNANTPAAYKFFTIAQHYVITGLSFRAEFITLDYVINIYPSHHLSFGHTSPQLVDHGIYELAQKMNMMIVLISPIFIIYHCLFINPTFHWCLVFRNDIGIKIHMSVFCVLFCPETFANMFTQQFLNNLL